VEFSCCPSAVWPGSAALVVRKKDAFRVLERKQKNHEEKLSFRGPMPMRGSEVSISVVKCCEVYLGEVL
jgi:hypothetical protein